MRSFFTGIKHACGMTNDANPIKQGVPMSDHALRAWWRACRRDRGCDLAPGQETSLGRTHDVRMRMRALTPW